MTFICLQPRTSLFSRTLVSASICPCVYPTRITQTISQHQKLTKSPQQSHTIMSLRISFSVACGRCVRAEYVRVVSSVARLTEAHLNESGAACGSAAARVARRRAEFFWKGSQRSPSDSAWFQECRIHTESNTSKLPPTRHRLRSIPPALRS